MTAFLALKFNLLRRKANCRRRRRKAECNRSPLSFNVMHRKKRKMIQKFKSKRDINSTFYYAASLSSATEGLWMKKAGEVGRVERRSFTQPFSAPCAIVGEKEMRSKMVDVFRADEFSQMSLASTSSWRWRWKSTSLKLVRSTAMLRQSHGKCYRYFPPACCFFSRERNVINNISKEMLLAVR